MRKLLAVLLLLPTLAFADAKRAIETNLATVVAIQGVQGKSLEARMKELGVPALSYAVVEDGKVVLAAAYGDADIAAGRRATPNTLFQAASISKPVTAMAAMELVERGKLSLDTPINSILKSWKLPDNELTAATPVTLRMLLSHSAGTTVHGFRGYARDEQRPTLAQVLNGQPPANSPAIVVDIAPNTKFRYSGGGTTIVQQALIDQTGLAFPDFMRRTVLQPLGMSASTLEQPLPAARHAVAATGYRFGKREVDGKWHVYPEIAAAGLWTTPGDLAKVVIEVQNALAGRKAKLLTLGSAKLMTTPRFESMAVGFGVADKNGTRYFAHNGGNEGFRCMLIGTVDGSRGAVVMTNSDAGVPLAQEVIDTIAREYHWPGYETTPLQPVRMEDPTSFVGRYELPSKEIIAMRSLGPTLEVLDLTSGWQRLYPTTEGKLARTDRDIRYAMEAAGLSVFEKGSRAVAIRRPREEKPSADELLAAGEIDAAMAAYREQFRANPQSVPEAKLNETGWTLLMRGRTAQSLALLQLATELYPTSANTYDTLAEALVITGDTARAIAMTEEQLRRIDADPNVETREMLRRIGRERLAKLRK